MKLIAPLLVLSAPVALGFTVPRTTLPRGRELFASASPAVAPNEKKAQALNPDHDILLRVARGEQAHRTPIWLMRQVRTRISMTVSCQCSVILLLVQR